MNYIVTGKRIENLEDDVKTLLKKIKIIDKVKPSDSVVLKPNMGNLTYAEGVVTSPELIGHVVSALRDHVTEVIVGESDGIRYSCDAAFERTGIKRIVEDSGGREEKKLGARIQGVKDSRGKVKGSNDTQRNQGTVNKTIALSRYPQYRLGLSSQMYEDKWDGGKEYLVSILKLFEFDSRQMFMVPDVYGNQWRSLYNCRCTDQGVGQLHRMA